MNYQFTKQINSDKLQNEINTQISGLKCINTLDSNVSIFFDVELTESQYQILNTIVQDHVNTDTIKSVTPRQMRIALVMSNIPISNVETVIDSLPEPDKSVVRITWEYSIEFQRSNPLIASLGPALGLSETQIDQLFTLAATL
jgi:hypothetical protein